MLSAYIFSLPLAFIFMENEISFYFILFLGYISFVVFDMYSTYYCLTRTDDIQEKNPILRYIFNKIGILKGGLIIKNLYIIMLLIILINLNTNIMTYGLFYKYYLSTLVFMMGTTISINNYLEFKNYSYNQGFL